MFNCQYLEQDLPRYFPGHSIQVSRAPAGEVISSLVFSGSNYRLTNRTNKEPRFHKTAVNAMCDLISDLALAEAENSTSDLCFHASATATASGLILFPATRRAGKSVLSLALADQGARLFSDDFLPVTLENDLAVGQATGISPRLRLPLPDMIAGTVNGLVAERSAPNNDQYLYVPLDAKYLASAREPLGISAIVLPTRQEDGPAVLTPLPPSTVLKSLLKQNFATQRHGALVLDDLATIATSIQGYELSYCDPHEAAGLIMSRLGGLTPPLLTRFSAPKARADQTQATGDPKEYRRNSDCHAFVIDDCLFYARPDGSQVGHMDGSAVYLWTLLLEPTSESQAIELLQDAFSAVPADQIAADTKVVFQKLKEQGLIQSA